MRKLMACLVALAATAAANAGPINIDFSTYAPGTQVSSASGVTFTLSGGPFSAGTPTIGNNGFDSNTIGLANSASGDYPTAESLIFTFGGPASNIAFTFDNYGDNGFFGAPSFVNAYDSNGNLLETLLLNTGDGSQVFTLSSSGVKSLQFNNGSGGNYSWEFVVGSISADVATPEPISCLVFGGLLTGGGLLVRRRMKANVA